MTWQSANGTGCSTSSTSSVARFWPSSIPECRLHHRALRLRGETARLAGHLDAAREHAIAMYRAIPNAELAIVPGTSHGLLVEKPELCNLIIEAFLTTDPIQTFAPIRRK
jgi:pimeloyl-ACP methyl ester carboxylesterase